MDLPSEIIQIIGSYSDHNTKNLLRIINKIWCRSILKTHYDLYFITNALLPQIVQRFSQYSHPISISINKSRSLEWNIFMDNITKLGGLTGLEIKSNFTYDDRTETSRILTLTKLSRLQRINISNTSNIHDDSYLDELQTHLPALRSACLDTPCGPKMEIIAQNLTELNIGYIQYIYHCPGSFTKLKTLKLRTEAGSYDESALRHLSNLNTLHIPSIHKEFDIDVIMAMTGLEKLVLDQVRKNNQLETKLQNLSNLTNLTYLHLITSQDYHTNNILDLSNLSKLQTISINVKVEVGSDVQIHADGWFPTESTQVRSLKIRGLLNGVPDCMVKHSYVNLESLEVYESAYWDHDEQGPYDFIYEVGKLSHLTSFIYNDNYRGVDHKHLIGLPLKVAHYCYMYHILPSCTDLESLRLSTDCDLTNDGLAPLSKLSSLTQLIIDKGLGYQQQPKELLFESVIRLTSLQELYCPYYFLLQDEDTEVEQKLFVHLTRLQSYDSYSY